MQCNRHQTDIRQHDRLMPLAGSIITLCFRRATRRASASPRLVQQLKMLSDDSGPVYVVSEVNKKNQCLKILKHHANQRWLVSSTTW